MPQLKDIHDPVERAKVLASIRQQREQQYQAGFTTPVLAQGMAKLLRK